MIACQACGYSLQTTKFELLDTCPKCDPTHWTLHRLSSNNQNATGMLKQAIKRSHIRMIGQCFLTPKGEIVLLNLWRKYEKATKMGIRRQ